MQDPGLDPIQQQDLAPQEPTLEQAAQQEAEQIAAMEIQQIQQEEMLGVIPPSLAQEMETGVEQAIPQDAAIILQQEQTIASLPPQEAQQYEQTIIAAEQQAAQQEEQAGERQANKWDQIIRDA